MHMQYKTCYHELPIVYKWRTQWINYISGIVCEDTIKTNTRKEIEWDRKIEWVVIKRIKKTQQKKHRIKYLKASLIPAVVNLEIQLFSFPPPEEPELSTLNVFLVLSVFLW